MLSLRPHKGDVRRLTLPDGRVVEVRLKDWGRARAAIQVEAPKDVGIRLESDKLSDRLLP
jgi:hypothetical protein